ncbi:MAG: HEAT repeat domain-containing protein [Candidatus Thorarchaeota archaeon]
MAKSSKTPKKTSKSKKGSASKSTATKSKAKPKKAKSTKSEKKKARATAKKTRATKAPAKNSTSMKSKRKTTKKRTKRLDSSDMMNELELEIQSKDQQVCLGAVERLGVMKGPKATKLLLKVLKDQRFMVRIHAAAQLGERQDKTAVQGLIETLHDESLFVRQTAAGALENIGGVKASRAVSMAEKDGLLLDKLPEGKRLIER